MNDRDWYDYWYDYCFNPLRDGVPYKKEEKTMEKHWTFEGSNKQFQSYDEAETAAKKFAAKYQRDVTVYEAVAVVVQPIPSFEVKKL